MFTDFVLKVKCTIFWLNRGLMVYLDFYAPDFPKSTSKYFLQPSTFSLKHPIFVAILVKNHQIMKNTFGNSKIWKLSQQYIYQNFRWLSNSKVFSLKTLNPQAPRSMLSNYFGKKHVLRDTFGEIWHIQIQIYPQTPIEPRYGAFYLTNKVSAHGLGLLVQLSWRVAPP